MTRNINKRWTITAAILFVICNMLARTSAWAQCANSINIYNFTNGSTRYELVKEKKTWANAAACASERGGFLVQIDSSSEQSAVYSAILASGVSSH